MKCFQTAMFSFIILQIQAAPVALTEYLKLNKHKVVFTGNPVSKNPSGSSHLGKCLRMQLQNTSNETKEIEIANGTHLYNKDSSNQDLIITEHLIVSIPPNQLREIILNAVCGEKTNAAPGIFDTFNVGYLHKGHILKLTDIFNKHHCFENTAQEAVWCFTNNNRIENILNTNEDTLIENEVIKYVASAKGLPIPKRKIYEKPILKIPVNIIGVLEYRVEKPTTIGLYLTDSNNVILETFWKDEYEARSGNAKYSYGYNGNLAKGLYWVQFRINGVLRRAKELRVE